MKANYENWVQVSVVRTLKVSSFFSLLFSVIFLLLSFINRVVNGEFIPVLLVLSILFLLLSFGLIYRYKRVLKISQKLDFSNLDSPSWKIVHFIADKVKIDKEKLNILDVGCGSGALTIAVAKNNPASSVKGVDIWSVSYKDYSKRLCYDNAKAEGVDNVKFKLGDACKLELKDEGYDVVVSNYVYSNIPVYPDSRTKRQDILLETLRVLKKGGVFAIHDIFSNSKFGKMDDFIKKLNDMGYERVELISTTDGYPMTKGEARSLNLSRSHLLYGIK